jgi:extradiol dioxygenase family protein
LVEDVEKLYEETSKKGVTFNNPPASMFDEEGKLLRKAAYAQDPDGNWLEFIELF